MTQIHLEPIGTHETDPYWDLVWVGQMANNLVAAFAEQRPYAIILGTQLIQSEDRWFLVITYNTG